jgi:glycine cleavage system H protein
MKNIPKSLRYTPTHEWLRLEGDNTACIGITDHAQASLGDIVFVELPLRDKKIKKGEEICVLESVKAAADVYSPLSGEIIETNHVLSQSPELINSDPYGEGWLFRIKFVNSSELESLLFAENYHKELSVEPY